MICYFVFKVPMVTTESGLQYKDIVVGEGPNPPIGFQVGDLLILVKEKMFEMWAYEELFSILALFWSQVAANYVAMVPSGQVFDR